MPDKPSSASPHTVQPGRELTMVDVIRLIVTESSMMRIRRFIEVQAPVLCIALFAPLEYLQSPTLVKTRMHAKGRFRIRANARVRRLLQLVTFPRQEISLWTVNCDSCKAGKRGRRRDGEIRQSSKRECQEGTASREAR